MRFTVPTRTAATRGWRVLARPGRTAVALMAAVATVLATLAAIPPTTATAAVPRTADLATAPDAAAAAALSAEDRASMAAQEPYLELDEQVRQLAAQQRVPPLAGNRIDIANRTLHVHWVGAAPAGLARIQEAAAERGITVAVTPAAHSEQTLMTAATELSTAARAAETGLSITIRHDGSGLTVRQDGLPAVARGQRAPSQFQSRVVDAAGALTARSGIPVGYAEGRGRTVLASRNSDFSPYSGGAVTVSRGLGCTNAFSMFATGAPSTRFMLTAAHCSAYLDGQLVTNGTNSRMGVTDFIHELFDAAPAYDLGVIRIDSDETNEGRIYSNDTTANRFPVKGMASGIPRGGNYCVSGAVHFPNCNIVSTDQDLSCPGGAPRCFFVIRWLSNTGNTVMCHGDSGGPIYYWTSTGIIAAGVASVGTGPPGTECFRAGGVSVVASAAGRIPGLAVLRG